MCQLPCALAGGLGQSLKAQLAADTPETLEIKLLSCLSNRLFYPLSISDKRKPITSLLLLEVKHFASKYFVYPGKNFDKCMQILIKNWWKESYKKKPARNTQLNVGSLIYILLSSLPGTGEDFKDVSAAFAPSQNAEERGKAQLKVEFLGLPGR